MVNVTCCGNQDRNTTTSSTFPNRPPNRTRNCYVTGQFDYMNCDGYNSSCTGPGIPASASGGCNSCMESSHGGYCKINDKYYTSRGGSPVFTELTHDDLIELTQSQINPNLQINRAIVNYDRLLNNRIRELQIMGQYPYQDLTEPEPETKPKPKPKPKPKKEKTSNTLFYIGIIISLLVLLSSITYILIQKKIIKI